MTLHHITATEVKHQQIEGEREREREREGEMKHETGMSSMIGSDTYRKLKRAKKVINYAKKSSKHFCVESSVN